MGKQRRFSLLVAFATLVAVGLALLVPYHQGVEYCGSVLLPAMTEDSGPCISNSGPHVYLVYGLLLGIPIVASIGRLLREQMGERRDR